jgi:hypothetical protein
MRKLISISAIVTLSATVLAHEGHHEHKASNKLTGEIVDITCYVDHQSKGEKHAACAQKCISAGNPVGIVADGRLYVVIQDNHESPNARLAPFAGQLVTITGPQLTKDGMRIVDMESVEPAAK